MGESLRDVLLSVSEKWECHVPDRRQEPDGEPSAVEN